MKTFNAKAEEVERKWWIIDAADQKVGRIATTVATILRGKNKAIYTPNVDTGDFVVIINTDKMELSGTKWEDKKYYRHSRFFGSMKEMTAAQAKEKDSTFIIHEAVRGMLPDRPSQWCRGRSRRIATHRPWSAPRPLCGGENGRHRPAA